MDHLASFARLRLTDLIAVVTGDLVLINAYYGPELVVEESLPAEIDVFGEPDPLADRDVDLCCIDEHAYQLGAIDTSLPFGSLLLPEPLLNAFLEQSGSQIPAPAEREWLAKRAAATFDVNPIVARIRLDSLFPQKERFAALDLAKKAVQAD